VIDAHVHVASPDTTRYPLRPTGVGSEWWKAGGSVHELVQCLDATGVERAVVVQAVGVYGYDNSYAAAAVGGRDDARLALVVAVDMGSPDPAAAIAADAATSSPSLGGVRLFGVDARPTSWLTDGRASAVFDLARARGVAVVPTLFSEALPALRLLVERHPDVAVAVDHCAFPDMGGPGADRRFMSLADLPSVRLKVTSHNLHRQGDDGRPVDPASVLEPLAEVFGAARLCWGSDHPQHRTLDYPAMVAMACSACRNLSPQDQVDFLGGVSERLWWPSGR